MIKKKKKNIYTIYIQLKDHLKQIKIKNSKNEEKITNIYINEITVQNDNKLKLGSFKIIRFKKINLKYFLL